IGHRRRIDVAAGAGAHDHADLRDDAGGEHVALEPLAIAAERGDALLDARAAGVEQADDGRARLHRHVLHLHDFLRVRLRERAAEHGEVFREQIDRAAIDGAPAGDHTVAGHLGLFHAEFGRAVLDEHVELLERALVEQEFDALARGEFAPFVLGLDAGRTAAQPRLFPPLFQPVEDVFHRAPALHYPAARGIPRHAPSWQDWRQAWHPRQSLLRTAP